MLLKDKLMKLLTSAYRRRNRLKHSYEDWQYMTGMIDTLELVLKIIERSGKQ